MMAIDRACKKFSSWRLPEGCELYVTLEPCPMCMGAALNARIDKLFFGAYEQKGRSLTNELAQANLLNHTLEIQGCLLYTSLAAHSAKGILYIVMDGEIDEHSAAEARRKADEIIDENTQSERAVFDLQNVSFMDSTGIGFLIGRYKRLKRYGIPMYISCLLYTSRCV